MHTYHINEIFYSLQGEGFHTGQPAVFVRFAGCNLRCPFCDTDFSHSEPMTAQQIAERVFTYSTDPHTLIVLTGGEPSLQVDNQLIKALRAHHMTIAIETNGTRQIPDGIDWVTVSPKADDSVTTSTKANGSVTPLLLTHANEVKIVFTPQTLPLLDHWRSTIQADHYFLQPCSCANTDEVIAYILAHPYWRLSLQTHKYLHIR